MDLQQEISRMVRQAVMEEINGLAIRATIREKIEAAGVTDGDIREMVQETADSYFKSGMNPKALQYIMGHANVSITLDTYTHVGYKDAEAEMLRIASGE